MSIQGEIFFWDANHVLLEGSNPNGSSSIFEFYHDIIYLNWRPDYSSLRDERGFDNWIVKDLDHLTPILQKSLNTGKWHRKIQVSLFRMNPEKGEAEEYMQYILEDAKLIGLYNYWPDSRKGPFLLPMERVRFLSLRYTWRYLPDGIESCFDFRSLPHYHYASRANSRKHQSRVRPQSKACKGSEIVGVTVEMNPQFRNLCWLKDGRKISKAQVGEPVTLSASVQNLAEGEPVKLRIYERDADGADDFIEEHTLPVKNCKIELQWQFEYHQDEDDLESEAEQQQKGYTKPEYIFTLEAKNVKSQQSPLLGMKDWIEFACQDEEGQMIANMKIQLLWPDGRQLEINADQKGIINLLDELPGEYQVAAVKLLESRIKKRLVYQKH